MQKIAFVDLEIQQQKIRERLDRRIASVLDHGQYIMGPEVAELECNLAAFTGTKHAISCSSGTDALLIAMMAKGVAAGQGVLCPAFTYTATPETIALLGAIPIFVDVDRETFNITAETIEAGILESRRRGVEPVAIIAVDLFGLPAPYDAIAAIAAREGMFVVADAAQSFGASKGSKRVGALAEITATSFFPAKPLGCYGDGGALFTDDDRLATIMNSIRLHGKGDDKYDIVRIGINGRLDTLQAAILLEKLAIFEDEIAQRNTVANRYIDKLSGHCDVPAMPKDTRSVWAQFTVKIPDGRRDAVAANLKAKGIPTAIYYPRIVPEQPAYASIGEPYGGLDVSKQLAREVLSLPIHPYLETAQQDYIISELTAALDGAKAS
jgi:dTDP-4-amino-4,6-dideoxygalactose transaminase